VGIFTENAAFSVTDSVFKCINQKVHVGGIFCNLNHEILVANYIYMAFKECLQIASGSV
jgi:hypothetical protein